MASFEPPGVDTAPAPLAHDDHALLRGALRRGKWTPEEEAYAAATIQYFLSGVLPIQYGTTLRGYIAQLLHCDPMRVSKKLIPGSVLVGVRIDPKIGRRSYYPCAEGTPGLEEHMLAARQRLAQFRACFIESIEREELHEQSAGGRAAVVDSRRLSPLSHKADPAGAPVSVIELRPLAYEQAVEDADADADIDTDASIARPPSLPSLHDLLRQNRLRVPSNSTLSPPHADPHHQYQHQFLHPTHASVFHYASPPRSSRHATTPPP